MSLDLAQFQKKKPSNDMFGIFRGANGNLEGYSLQLGDRKTQKPWHNEFFPDKEFKGKKKALLACKSRRDSIMQKGKFKAYYKKPAKSLSYRQEQSNNKTGITGVSYNYVPGSNSHLFKSQCGQKPLDSFSARKHSAEGAFLSAAQSRLSYVGEEYDEEKTKELFKKWLKGKKQKLIREGIPVFLDDIDGPEENLNPVNASSMLNELNTNIPGLLIQAKRSRSNHSVKAVFLVTREGKDNLKIDIKALGFKKALRIAFREQGHKNGPKLTKVIADWCTKNADAIEKSGIDL